MCEAPLLGNQSSIYQIFLPMIHRQHKKLLSELLFSTHVIKFCSMSLQRILIHYSSDRVRQLPILMVANSVKKFWFGSGKVSLGIRNFDLIFSSFQSNFRRGKFSDMGCLVLEFSLLIFQKAKQVLKCISNPKE